MDLKNWRSLGWYFKVYQYVGHYRFKKNDTDHREIHSVLMVVFSTSVLMFAYAALACTSISSSIPWVVGIIASVIHLLSPLCFRFTNNSIIPCNVLLTAGLVHMSTFSYYTGGFLSNILIWFGILPLIGGVIKGRRGATTWLVITVLVAGTFFISHTLGFRFPNLISAEGFYWSQTLIVFGWIYLSSTIVIVYAGLREHTEKKLKEQSEKVDELFRVLFHDLANPLGRVAIGLSIAKRQIPESENNRGFEIAQLASESMLEITQNIRRMYAVRKGKANVDLSPTSFNAAVEYVMKVYNADLEKKKIKINYHFEKHEGLHLLVEPVSFNNQVLGNIISNAIKFSPVDSHIFLTAYPAGPGHYVIEVKDNGIGIPETLMMQIFDINKKTTRPGTQGEVGTGFGMHIMKTFIEMYGGKIHVESTEGQTDFPSGTTIKMYLKGEWN